MWRIRETLRREISSITRDIHRVRGERANRPIWAAKRHCTPPMQRSEPQTQQRRSTCEVSNEIPFGFPVEGHSRPSGMARLRIKESLHRFRQLAHPSWRLREIFAPVGEGWCEVNSCAISPLACHAKAGFLDTFWGRRRSLRMGSRGRHTPGEGDTKLARGYGAG